MSVDEPLTYRIDPEVGVVEFVGPTPEMPALVRLIRRAVWDPAYRPGFGFLRDRTGQPALSASAVHHLAEVIVGIEELAGTRWAIVAPDPVNFGTMRMLELIVAPHRIEVGVFNERAEALHWLVTRRADPENARPNR